MAIVLAVARLRAPATTATDTALQSTDRPSTKWIWYRSHKCGGLSYALFKAFSCRSPTALKKPDRLKQCHCLQFC